jgi:hypothetical protein
LKFRCNEDLVRFNLERGVSDISLLESLPSTEDIQEFLTRNREQTYHLKDFRKSQNAKQSWRKNRYAMMKGIKGFHKSTAGKRFHRNLSRFMLTRESFQEISDTELLETLKAISSYPTHLFIDLGYYRSLDEQVDFELLLDEALPTIFSLINSISKTEFKLSESEADLLYRLINPTDLILEIKELNKDKIINLTESDVYNAECIQSLIDSLLKDNQ